MKRVILIFLLWCPVVLFAQDTETVPIKSQLCTACHGGQGLSVNSHWPNLAGQHSTYLFKQLKDYKDGSRSNPLMLSVIENLTEDEMKELASFYNAQTFSPKKIESPHAAKGETIYRSGDFQKKIMACITCHGPKGLGNHEAGFPVLVGQNRQYIIEQLLAFKDKKRGNDLNAIMQDLCARMSNEDIEAVALYIQGLNP